MIEGYSLISSPSHYMTKSQPPRMDKTLKKNSTEVAHSLPLLYITSLTLPLPSIDLLKKKAEQGTSRED
jgi:hypothetical protein